MAEQILAVDMGTDSVKVVLGSVSEQGITPLFAGIQRNEKLMDEPSNSQLHKDWQKQALSKLVQQAGVSYSRICCGADLKSSIRFLDLPFDDKKKIAQILPFELEHSLASKLEEQVFDYFPIDYYEKNLQKHTRLLIALIEKKTLRETLIPFQELGRDPDKVIPTALGHAMLWSFQQRNDLSNEDKSFIVDIGHQGTHISLVSAKGKIPVGYRFMYWGGHYLDKKISMATNVNLADARALKHKFIFDEANGAHLEAVQLNCSQVIHQEIEMFCTDLKQTLLMLQSVSGYSAKSLYITGGGSLLSGLQESIEKIVGITVKNFSSGWLQEAHTLKNPPATNLLYETAWGLLAAAQEKNINFRKGEFVLRTNFDFLKEKKWSLLACVTILIVGILFYIIGYGRFLSKFNDRLDVFIAEHAKEWSTKPTESIKNLAAELTSRKDLALAVQNGKIIPKASALGLLEKFAKVSQSVSSDALLEDITISEHRFVIQGTVPQLEDVNKIKDALSKDGCFKNIDVGNSNALTLGDFKGYRYRMTADVGDCL